MNKLKLFALATVAFLSFSGAANAETVLLASDGLLSSRRGHTEMSIYLTKLARLVPITTICEMMDSQTYSALSVTKAEKYAEENAIPFVDGKELLEFSKVN